MLSGKGTREFHFGNLMPDLSASPLGVADDRKPYFEMQTSKADEPETKLRRCSALEVTNPCPNEPSIGALCIECIDPSDWVDYCDSYP